MSQQSTAIPLGLKRVASSCVLYHGESLLLLKRFNDPYKGFYLPPGGKVEPFENPRATAIRETFEETGLQVDQISYCGSLVETSPMKYNWITFIYKVEIDYVDPPASSEGILKWIRWNNLNAFPIPETDYPIYDYLRSGKPFALNADFDKDQQIVAMWEEIEGKQVLP